MNFCRCSAHEHALLNSTTIRFLNPAFINEHFVKYLRGPEHPVLFVTPQCCSLFCFFFSSVRDRLKTSVWLFNFSQKVSALFCRNQTEVNVKHSLLQTCDCTRLNCQLLATGLLGKNFNKKPNSAKRPKRLFEGQKKQTFLWHCYYSFVTKKTSITRASLDFNFVISSGDHQQQAPGDGLLCPVVYVCTA